MEEKLRELKDDQLLLTAIKVVHELHPATHRLRIGDYRLLVRMEESRCIILKVGHRRDIYH